MREKNLTTVTYVAGASLAAITLVYVFAPTFFIDEQSADASASARKKGVVGLSNSANDCFINSVLQALASLGDLRAYLIRETHRRTLDDAEVYAESPENHPSNSSPSWKIEGLQQGLVTHGLKEILDALNERPIYKKTISAAGFVAVLEKAFRQRISRQQQDAQEFLQVVAERLNDEYHAGHMARQRARATLVASTSTGKGSSIANGMSKLLLSADVPTVEHAEDLAEDQEAPSSAPPEDILEKPWDDEDGFPLEGTSESQIECLTCGFKPKPSETTFCSLTVNVPQVVATSLSLCFDGIFKTEHIEDFKCEKCRLLHAVEFFQSELVKSKVEGSRTTVTSAIERLQEAIESDPEKPPPDIELPDSKYAPKRKIARHVRITKFPKVLAIHLSRSIFDYGQASMKNSAKVSFPEHLQIGGLLDRRSYKLLAVTTHKGSHQSGHYETFRRQFTYPTAFSTPNAINPNGVYGLKKTACGRADSNISDSDDAGSPTEAAPLHTAAATEGTESAISRASTSERDPRSSGVNRLSTDSRRSSSLFKRLSIRAVNTRKSSRESDPDLLQTSTADNPSNSKSSAETSSISSSLRHRISGVNNQKGKLNEVNGNGVESSREISDSGLLDGAANVKGKKVAGKHHKRMQRREKRQNERWWRISDEKVKESKTPEVLGMQREVYLLFYELER